MRESDLEPPSSLGKFASESRRCKVVRVAAVYAVGAWLLLQVGDKILGLAGLPAWAGQLLLAAGGRWDVAERHFDAARSAYLAIGMSRHADIAGRLRRSGR